MSLSWLVGPQQHKITNGYYINHDNLMLASPAERRKLIFYYIASQTPEKITSQDHREFLDAKAVDLDFRNLILTAGISLYAMTALSQQKLVTTRISNRPFFNSFVVLGSAMLSAAAAYNISWIMFEPIFVSNNKVVTSLAEKYNFSVFDFALAKKEARLKQIRQELTSDSSNAAHM